MDWWLAEGEDFWITINKSTFENECKYLFEKCIEPMKQTLNDANLKINDIDEVVMVGGSSRIPNIQEIVSNVFNGKKQSMKLMVMNLLQLGQQFKVQY